MRILSRSPKLKQPRQLRDQALLEGLESRCLLSAAPPLPVIPTGPGTQFVVTAAPYNAVGDGVTDDTAAIQSAINDCSAAGGGTVEIPDIPGTNNVYEFSTLTLASNINFQVDTGAELQALPMADQAAGLKEFIYGSQISNFEISGGGDVDGNGGSGWWATTSPPDLFQLNGVSTVLIQNITLTNSPLEHLPFGHAGTVSNNDVTINNVTVLTPSTTSDTDGIDPSGSNFLIENCHISDGDDDIAVKPQHSYCNNITITNCTIGYGHGISIGGETNDGANNITVTNCTLNGTTWGLRLKAGRGNGGLVENVSYSNITMTNVQYPIFIFSYYVNGSDTLPTDPSADPGQPVNGLTPLWQNISFNNITATDTKSNSYAGVIYGLPEAPATNISFNNVNITANYGMEIDHARNVTFDSLSHITVASGADLISSTNSPQFPTPYDATVLAAGFVNSDVASPTVPAGTSSVIYDPDSQLWTIQGDGTGVNEIGDQFNYSYEIENGDGSLSAELDSLTNLTKTSQAGLMFRAGLANNAPFVAIMQLSSNNDDLLLESRSTAAAPDTVNDVYTSAPRGQIYSQLVRTGSTFTAYFSTDDIHWTEFGSVNVPNIPTTADAGLFASSEINGDVITATFSSVTANLTPATGASMSGSSIFYNDSAFDGDDPTPNGNDLNAIAPDKSPLFPGGTATYSNLSNYSNGINGIIIDMANLPPNTTLQPSDFQFATGNASDTTTWTTLPTAPTITLLTPTGSITPVDLTWPNHTIQNTWLQITVLATADTGLSANNVFYFGNLVGKVPDTSSPEQVTALDLATIEQNIVGTATITNPYDINRDGSVDAEDLVLTQDNSFSALNLITPTGNGPVPTATTTVLTATPQIAAAPLTSLLTTDSATSLATTPDTPITDSLLKPRSHSLHSHRIW
jgi:polygalacturonase